METNTAFAPAPAANDGAYGPTFKPGDVVCFEGRRKRYMVTGVSKGYCGAYRYQLSAMSGGMRASSADAVKADRLTLAGNQSRTFTGAQATQRAQDAFRRALNYTDWQICRRHLEDLRAAGVPANLSLDAVLDLQTAQILGLAEAI